jgi:hypothetical protein
MRLLPYVLADGQTKYFLMNLTPIWAVTLFGSAAFRKVWMSWVGGIGIPLVTMVAADLFLSFSGLAILTTVSQQLVVYASIALAALVGMTLLRKDWTILRIGFGVFASVVVSDILLNTYFWIAYPPTPLPADAPTSLMGLIAWSFTCPPISGYPRTLEGWICCNLMSYPFLLNKLLGNLAGGLVLFGGFALAQVKFPILREESAGASGLATA